MVAVAPRHDAMASTLPRTEAFGRCGLMLGLGGAWNSENVTPVLCAVEGRDGMGFSRLSPLLMQCTTLDHTADCVG